MAQREQARICWMKVKEIAWGISSQAARLIYRHMVHMRVSTCGKHPMQHENKHRVSMETMGRKHVTIESSVGILTPKSCASTSGRTLSCPMMPGHKGSGGVI